MRLFLISVSIFLMLSTIGLFWHKRPNTIGIGQAEEVFVIDRPFFQVALKLRKKHVGEKINEASGCKIIQSKLIKKEKEGKIRHVLYETIKEIDVAGEKRRIKVRDESKANIKEGWIINVSRQISHDEIVSDHWAKTRITRIGFGIGSKTKIEMQSHIEIKGIPTILVNMNVKSGLAHSRAEFIRQME